MSAVATLPGIEIKCGQVFAGMTVNLTDSAGDPIDLTNWTARFTIAERYGEAAALVSVPSTTALGVITVALSAAETLTLQDFGDCCMVFQLDVDADDASAAHRMQGPVKLYPENL
jgi:hypothetical protein